MTFFKRKGWLLAGLALIALSNCWILASVAYNRSGEPDSSLLLSERELSPSRSWKQQESSGVALALLTLQPRTSKNQAPISLNVMEQLGFSLDFPDDASTYAHPFMRQPSRAAIVVLEFDGKAHQAEIRARQKIVTKAREALNAAPGDKRRTDELKYAENALQRARSRDRRLYVVDAGLDAARLRQRYPDRKRFVLVPGRVQPWMNHRVKPAIFGGRAEPLLREIQVPFEWRAQFRSEDPANCCQDHQYTLEVLFGRNLQPWVDAVPQLPRTVAKDDVSPAER